MKSLRFVCFAIVAGLLFAAASDAQEGPKPGPEHALLKKMEGAWDATMNFGGMESKGTSVYKMELGGLWLSSTFEGEFGGMKFSGKGLDGYDPVKKKFVGVWVDSMSTAPMLMEGTHDKEKNTTTMTGEGPGPDGKPTKYKAVNVMKDNNTMLFSMYMGDGKEPAFVITYKRRK